MNYFILPENLRSIADIVLNYMKNDLGLSKIKIESSIDDRIEYRPTFYAIARNYYIYCIDVSETIYNPTRWSFITNCEHNCIPIKFYIALPSVTYSNFANELKQAKDASVGIIEVNRNHCNQIYNALSLSNSGLRKFDKLIFPKRYREMLVNAESTFRNGDPNKACSNIYDEIESLTRKIAIQSYKKSQYKQAVSDPNSFQNSLSWSKVLLYMMSNMKRDKLSIYSCITDDLIIRVQSIVSFRNQSGHKLDSIKSLIKRDSQLRTRMESSIDLLLDLINATKSLHVL